jgi:hypothetical protein
MQRTLFFCHANIASPPFRHVTEIALFFLLCRLLTFVSKEMRLDLKKKEKEGKKSSQK